MDWITAARTSMLLAARTHRKYNSDLTRWIDVFGVLAQADVILAFRPMGRLEAAAIDEPDLSRGVIVNSSRPLPRQRFSAAHEFGHLTFGHKSVLDLDTLIERGRPVGWTDHEKLAESFAAWFLMPHELIEASLSRLGLVRPSTPEDVYQLSLRMGTSYESTARHLVDARVCSRERAMQWQKTQPADIKRKLAEAFAPPEIRNEVHLLTMLDNKCAQLVRAGDRVIINLEEKPTSGYRWHPAQLPVAIALIDDCYIPVSGTKHDDDKLATGATQIRRLVLEIKEPEATGTFTLTFDHKRAWQNKEIDQFFIDLTIEQSERLGISETYFKAA